MKEKLITVDIGGTKKRFTEEEFEKAKELMQKLKEEYLGKGAPLEMVERACGMKILKDER